MPGDSYAGVAWKPKGQQSPNPRADQRECLWDRGGVTNQSWVEGSFEVGTRTMLDNPMPSAKVARRHAKVKLRKEILPNPSGGVNTHLWDNEAYIVGIVHVVRPDL